MLRAWLLLTSVAAADRWSTLAEGVTLYETELPGPNRLWAVYVDLRQPNVALRTTMQGEQGQTVSSWAAQVGARVAVAGDFTDPGQGYVPTGLAVSRGHQWNEDREDWRFLACNVDKTCVFDTPMTYTRTSPRWWNAVGGEHEPLVIAGVAHHADAPYYASERHPRTAVALDADGARMILVVVDGRSQASIGMTQWELADTLVSLGAWEALNLDGGGSTTLVVDGVVRNTPSDGAERVIGSHLGIVLTDTVDPRCERPNGSWCAGAQAHACEAGTFRAIDCGMYGLGCEEDGAIAYCLDPRCTHGGQRADCLDRDRIARCRDGVVTEGDCAAADAACVEGFDDAWCAQTFFQATVVATASDDGPVDVARGETAQAWVDLRNTGLDTWMPGEVFLAPLPRDVASPLADASWVSPTRVATVPGPVAPGETVRVPVPLHGTVAGAQTLSLGLVAERVTWFGDRPGGGGPADGSVLLALRVADDADSGPTDGASLLPGSTGGCGCGGGRDAAATFALLPLLRRRRAVFSVRR